MGALIADVERECFFFIRLTRGHIRFEAEFLKSEGALDEPVMLGHALDEDLLSWRGWLVLFDEAFEKQIEVF